MCEQASTALGSPESAQLYRLVAENCSDMIVGYYGPEIVRAYVSPASEIILGYRPDELVGRSPLNDIHPDDRDTIATALTDMTSGIVRPMLHYRQRHKNGDYIWLEASYRPVGDAQKIRFVATVRDISQRKAAEVAAAEAMACANESLRLLTMAEEIAQVGHWRLHSASRTFLWSPTVYHIYGLPAGGTPSIEVALAAYHPDDQAMVSKLIRAAIRTGKDFDFRARIVRPSGELRHIVSRGQAEYVADGTVVGLFGVIQDVTREAQVEAALQSARDRAEAAAQTARRLAETDELTGLANRRMFLRQLDLAIDASCAAAQPLSAALFDIDNFKSVNDRYGHAVGDAVLERIARIAVDAAGPTRTVGRLGGEEFGVLMHNEDTVQAAAVGDRIRMAIACASDNTANLPATTVSVGVAMLQAGMAPSGLLAAADAALYQAKRAGRNRVCIAA